jgi:hypothetical protein
MRGRLAVGGRMRKGLVVGLAMCAALAFAPAAQAQPIGLPAPGAHTAAYIACYLSGLYRDPERNGLPPSGTRVCWNYSGANFASLELVGVDGVAGVWTDTSSSAQGGTSEGLIVKVGPDSKPGF